MMKSIFDNVVRQEVLARIDLLKPESKALWGSMTVAQMVRHCALCEEYYFGNVNVKRSMMGRFFGKKAIKEILKDENSSFAKNAPTSPQFRVMVEPGDLHIEKEKWKELIDRYATYSKEDFVHWFFGKMSKEQLGQFIYKHCHHHLQQFGV